MNYTCWIQGENSWEDCEWAKEEPRSEMLVNRDFNLQGVLEGCSLLSAFHDDIRKSNNQSIIRHVIISLEKSNPMSAISISLLEVDRVSQVAPSPCAPKQFQFGGADGAAGRTVGFSQLILARTKESSQKAFQELDPGFMQSQSMLALSVGICPNRAAAGHGLSFILAIERRSWLLIPCPHTQMQVGHSLWAAGSANGWRLCSCVGVRTNTLAQGSCIIARGAA